MKFGKLIAALVFTSLFSAGLFAQEDPYKANVMVQLDKGKTIPISTIRQAVNSNIPMPASARFGTRAQSPILVRTYGKLLIIESAARVSRAPGAVQQAYRNGDVTFMIGHGAEEWGENEWTRYYGVAKFLAQNQFRVIMNPFASSADLQATIQFESTSIIIWSSHGSQNGNIYDINKQVVPYDVFSINPTPRFKQLILSSCYSANVKNLYKIPPSVNVVSWNGTTNSGDLFGYLYSNDWNPIAAINR